MKLRVPAEYPLPAQTYKTSHITELLWEKWTGESCSVVVSHHPEIMCSSVQIWDKKSPGSSLLLQMMVPYEMPFSETLTFIDQQLSRYTHTRRTAIPMLYGSALGRTGNATLANSSSSPGITERVLIAFFSWTLASLEALDSLLSKVWRSRTPPEIST